MEYYKINNDDECIYKIEKKTQGHVILKGVNFRKIKIVNNNEMTLMQEAEASQILNEDWNKVANIRNKKETKEYLLGKVLHIDADDEYLQKCIKLYKKTGVYCYPILSKEEELEKSLYGINIDLEPDVVVITGHDNFESGSIKNIENYTNSKHFIKAVKIIRLKYPNAVIIAGACQSHFEALIANGANFASSPERVNIHVFDPAIIAINVCYTSIKQIVSFSKMEKNIENLKKAFGGVETYGKMKLLYK